MVAALLLGLARWAEAQEPVPPPGQEGQTSPTRSPTSAWQLGATLSATWEDNIAFQTPNDPADFASAVAAGLTHSRRTRRGQLSLSLNGSGLFYARLTDLNRIDGVATLSSSYRLSSRVTATLGGDFAYGHTDQNRTLIEVGIQLPLVRTESFGGGAGFSFQLTSRTVMDLSLRYDEVDFAREDLVDTRSWNAGASLGRRLSQRDRLSVSYRYQRTGEAAAASETQFLSAGWNHSLARALSLNLGGGASHNVLRREPSTGRWFPDGHVALVGKVRRATLSLQYAHTVTPAYGLGRDQLSDIVTLSASVPFGRNWDLGVAGTHARTREARVATFRNTTDYFDLALRWRLTRRFGLALGQSLRRREDPQEIVSPRSSFSLFFGTPRL